MPPLVLSIVSFIQLAVKAAPLEQQVYNDARALINDLFAAKLITADQQAALMQWCDDHMAAILANQQPPEFKVADTATATVTELVVTNQAATDVSQQPPAPAPAPEPAIPAAPKVIFPTCSKELVPNGTENCNCQN
jgi:hypothetical protein